MGDLTDAFMGAAALMAGVPHQCVASPNYVNEPPPPHAPVRGRWLFCTFFCFVAPNARFMLNTRWDGCPLRRLIVNECLGLWALAVCLSVRVMQIHFKPALPPLWTSPLHPSQMPRPLLSVVANSCTRDVQDLRHCQPKSQGMQPNCSDAGGTWQVRVCVAGLQGWRLSERVALLHLPQTPYGPELLLAPLLEIAGTIAAGPRKSMHCLTSDLPAGLTSDPKLLSDGSLWDTAQHTEAPQSLYPPANMFLSGQSAMKPEHCDVETRATWTSVFLPFTPV